MSRPKECSVDGCDRVHKARGWCNMHWTRWRRHGSPHISLADVSGRKRRPVRVCQVQHCERKHYARGRCYVHYRQWQRAEEEPPEYLRGVFDNTTCEECGDTPMGGGRWCLPCFQTGVDERRREREVASRRNALVASRKEAA